MTKANGIAMIQELLASSQEEKTDAEQTELEAIETELGAPQHLWNLEVIGAP